MFVQLISRRYMAGPDRRDREKRLLEGRYRWGSVCDHFDPLSDG